MRLQFMTWPEVEEHLRRHSGLLLPIGSTEQHGPTGLMGTDALCADAVAATVGERVGGMVGPPINVGMAQHHMAFPGTVTLRPSTLIAVLVDHILSLAEHGFRRFLVVNGHGGNIPGIKAAFGEIHAETRARFGDQAPDLRLEVANWFLTPGVRALAEAEVGRAEGHHATVSEISLTQHLFPEGIRPASLLTGPAGDSHTFHDARDFRRRFPDGRMASDPALATPALGARFLEAAAADIAAQWETLVNDAG